MPKLSPWGLVMFSAAFDKLVYDEGKYYQPPRAPLHFDVTHQYNELSPWELVMFSAAFDKLVYGEGKYYQFPRAP